MKVYLHLILLAFLSLGVAACSIREEGTVDGAVGNGDRTYVTFRLSSPGTRSATDEEGETNSNADPESELGINPDENKISYVQLILLECTDETQDVGTDRVIAVSLNEPTVIDGTDGTRYTVAFRSEDLEAFAGDSPRKVRALAYCNHISSVAAVGRSLQDLYGETVHIDMERPDFYHMNWVNANETGEAPCRPDFFWMTNADRGLWDSPAKSLPPKADLADHHTVEAAIDLGVIEVERTVARIDLVKDENHPDWTYVLQEKEDGTPLVSVQFACVGLFNRNPDFYTLRRVSADGTPAGWRLFGRETPANYVVGPDWNHKSLNVSHILFCGASMGMIDYCTENIIPEGMEQLQTYATCVYFEFRITAAEGSPIREDMDARKRIYVYDHRTLYGAWPRVVEAARLAQEAGDPELQTAVNQVMAAWGSGVIDENSAEWVAAIRAAGFEQYHSVGESSTNDYHIYYNYYIRHNDNGNPRVSGPMEFAIVRDNVYKLKVKAINHYGTPEQPVPQPVPIEDEEVYLQVTTEVLPWKLEEVEVVVD